MSEDARQQLAAMQAQLVRALVEGAAAPADFDRERLAAAAESLRSKRAHTVARLWPQLASAMGGAFAMRFADYARAHPLSHDGNALADGRAFVDWLERAGLLSDEGRLEAFAFDARFQIRKDVITPRRGAWLRVGRFKALRRLIIVIRLPFIGERWLHREIL
jgi:hypothetical protein